MMYTRELYISERGMDRCKGSIERRMECFPATTEKSNLCFNLHIYPSLFFFIIISSLQMADTPNIQKLASYLNFKARIKITDGRVFIGTFMCIDKQKNVILANTREYREGSLNLNKSM